MKYGYYQLCEALQSAAVTADYITTTTWGNIFDVDMRKMTLFPLCHILVGNATINERTVTYEVDLLVMDVVDYSKQDPNVTPYSFEGVAINEFAISDTAASTIILLSVELASALLV